MFDSDLLDAYLGTPQYRFINPDGGVFETNDKAVAADYRDWREYNRNGGDLSWNQWRNDWP